MMVGAFLALFLSLIPADEFRCALFLLSSLRSGSSQAIAGGLESWQRSQDIGILQKRLILPNSPDTAFRPISGFRDREACFGSSEILDCGAISFRSAQGV